MMTRVFRLTCCLLLASMLLASPADAKEFRWKLKAGDSYKVNMVQNMLQKMNVMGQEIEVPNDMTMTMSWNVDSIDDKGVISMTQKIETMKMKMAMPGMAIEFDSTKDAEPDGIGGMIAGMLKPIIGQPITQKMTARGEVLETVLPEKALDGLKSNPILGQMFGEDQFKEMVSKGVPTFPEGSIDKGHTWTNESEVKLDAGAMKMKNSYTYAGEESVDGATLDKFDVKTEIEFSGGGQFGAEIKVTEQDNQGAIYFNAVKGIFVKSEMKQSMKLNITVAGQNIDQEMTTTVKMNVTPASAN